MIRQERKTWTLGERPPSKSKHIVLRSWNPTAPTFFLSNKILSKTTRLKHVQSWDDFFRQLRKAWQVNIGRGHTIEKSQSETLDDIIDWLWWLHGAETFSRGRARGIEELMQNFSQFVVLEGAKLRDKFRWMDVRLKIVNRMTWDVTEFLGRKYPGSKFKPFELHRLDEKPFKQQGRKFLRAHRRYRGLVNLNDYFKEVFRKPRD